MFISQDTINTYCTLIDDYYKKHYKQLMDNLQEATNKLSHEDEIYKMSKTHLDELNEKLEAYYPKGTVLVMSDNIRVPVHYDPDPEILTKETRSKIDALEQETYDKIYDLRMLCNKIKDEINHTNYIREAREILSKYGIPNRL